jgi:hypothetical protein
MKYLIITQDPITGQQSAFYTNWFDTINNYSPEYNMIVINQTQRLISFDGETWQDIDNDHL